VYPGYRRDVTAEEFHDALHAAVGRPRQEVRTSYAGRIVYKQVIKEPGAHRARWAEATVNLATHTIKVQVNLDLKKNKLSQQDYLRLCNLVLRGMRTYWSRPIQLRNETFQVDVNAITRSVDAVEVDLYIETGKDYARSHNMSILGIDASFIYNAGFWPSQSYADDDFMLTAAHEFGHSVLMEFGGLGHSWTHKGSTSIVQATKSSTPGYPTSGEIDLMRYYDEKKQSAPFARTVKDSRANELDVKCLLWMSKLGF
jgi:hypothetical protein